jgi:hypothetical protein
MQQLAESYFFSKKKAVSRSETAFNCIDLARLTDRDTLKYVDRHAFAHTVKVLGDGLGIVFYKLLA